MITSNEYVLLAVGVVWVIGVAVVWVIGVAFMYFKCKRLYIDVQEYIDDIESEDRADEYLYKQLMKAVGHDK